MNISYIGSYCYQEKRAGKQNRFGNEDVFIFKRYFPNDVDGLNMLALEWLEQLGNNKPTQAQIDRMECLLTLINHHKDSKYADGH